jgi:hypothetical protein
VIPVVPNEYMRIDIGANLQLSVQSRLPSTWRDHGSRRLGLGHVVVILATGRSVKGAKACVVFFGGRTLGYRAPVNTSQRWVLLQKSRREEVPGDVIGMYGSC